MHLLSTLEATTADVDVAVDLDQTPGQIVFLSAADSELACLARAQARLPDDAPTVRLANLLQLAHPMSVDLYADRVVANARLVVLRLLGGRGYWPYGVEQLAATCRSQGIPLACLPGDDRPDPDLAGLSTLPAEACARIWAYLGHGGVDNALQALRYAAALIGRGTAWEEPRPLPRAGLYHPQREVLDPADWPETGPRALVVFYRALLQSGDLAAVDALLLALERAGLHAAGVYVASLKDGDGAALLAQLIETARPAVLLNATAFAVGAEAPDPLAAADAAVLQVIQAGSGEQAWRAGARGLGPRDLAMHVALPELDGRVLAGAVSFKAVGERDQRTEIGLVRHRPVADRVTHAAELAAAWARLRSTL
ncbi:MAG: cobaltochelatase subunit CobN, partial [Geminicoccaceae bacterium]